MALALLAGTTLALLLIGVALWLGLIPPNRHVGVCTGRTAANPRLWRRVNRRAGGDLCVLAGALGQICALGATRKLGPDATFIVYLVVMQLGLAVTLLRALGARIGRVSR
jgi:hypothetical protein